MTEVELETSVSKPVLLSYAWGIRLREARQAQGLSLQDVVNELHLDLKILKALEQEDLTQLPSASFVKGYLRNYARLLELSSDDIVAAFDAINEDDLPCLQKVSDVKQLSSQDKIPRIATWVVVAVLALSIIWWWSSIILSKGNDSLKSASGAVVQSAPLAQQPSVQADILVDGESVTVAPLMLPDAGEVIDSSEKLVEDTGVVVESDDVMSEEPPAPAPVEQKPAPQVEPINDERLAPPVTLTLEFEQDSWVEISDVTGKRLFFDLGREGQERKLIGIAPFKVLFGNGPGVRLFINGEPFDHVPHQRNGGVARFTLK